ncbi:MAG TPA: M15 family metallopeptidase [Bacteroidia bacterium]|nr:M15 family metallopeptidase [Bacteroidia bacterium]
MASPYPPMTMTDPRFIERIKDVQRELGFTDRDVDGKIGHDTLSRIEERVMGHGSRVTGDEIAAEKEPVGGGGNPVAGQAGRGGGPVSPAVPGGTSATPKVDERSAKNILTLAEKVRPFFELIAVEGTRIAKSMGADAYVMIGGTRTFAEQDALYAKGRTAPGPVVTNASGGYSNHNFGIAGDYGVFAGGRYLDAEQPALASRIHKAVAEWVRTNLLMIEWGGDWTSFRDEPHYQYRTGLSLAQMRERVLMGLPVV